MADPLKSSSPYTTSLRSDVLLLSCFLNSQQRSLSESHPDDKDLALSHDLCCLLAIGDDHHPKAENVNSNVWNVTQTGSTKLSVICTENARQDEGMVKHYKQMVKGRKGNKQGGKQGKKTSGKKEEINPPPTPILDPIPNPGICSVAILATIDPAPGMGRDLLNKWDGENLNSTVKLPK